MLQKLFIWNKLWYLDLSIHQRILEIHVLNIDDNNNVSWAAYYYDFWRSCDWSNDAENTEINDILTDIHIF